MADDDVIEPTEVSETDDASTATEEAATAESGTAAAAPAPETAAAAEPANGHVPRGRHNGRKVREGIVVSDKMDKTVIVEVEDRVKHPKYAKVIRRTRRYKAHDGDNACGVGECFPHKQKMASTKPSIRCRSIGAGFSCR